ncbi:hypothetical protein OIU79_030608 [Salix purpurea]|uniref:Uncharacterized protein n=1 Tax=Salix purpurea TaxID=77065 RepID=A0A9Q0V9I7_SALPP|nr:hypothetical protein OIU79_030608 [Salix purpurea]
MINKQSLLLFSNFEMIFYLPWNLDGV